MKIKKLNENFENETIIQQKAKEIWNSKEYEKEIQQATQIYNVDDDNPNALWKDGFENGFIECARIFNIKHIIEDLNKYNL